MHRGAWSTGNWFRVWVLSMSASVDNSTLDLGSVMPGQDATGHSVVTVTTSSADYNLARTDQSDTRAVAIPPAITTTVLDWTGTNGNTNCVGARR